MPFLNKDVALLIYKSMILPYFDYCDVVYTLRETRPLRTFDFGKRAIKVRKCDGKVTFTIHFQDIYLFIKGDLAQHQERSCIGDLSITFTIP